MNEYRSAAEAAHAAGFTYFDQLGYRQVPAGFEIWLRVMDPATAAIRLIKTQVPTESSSAGFDAADGFDAAVGFDAADGLVSVADLWGGARWAEQEFRRAATSLTPSGGFAHPEGPL